MFNGVFLFLLELPIPLSYVSIPLIPMQTEIEAKFTDIDLKGMRRLLRALGAELLQPETLMNETILESPAKRELRREVWSFMNCEMTFDTWPWIPSFMTAKGPTEEIVKTAIESIGCNWKYARQGDFKTVYQQHYDVTEDEINQCESIAFVPVPDWLEAKRRGKRR